MTPKRFALVGTGGRAISFIDPLVTRYAGEAELVGLCDPSTIRLEHYNRLLAGELGYHRVATCAPDQFERLLREQSVDTVLVTSVDATHHHYIVQALEAGCEVVTEKPMTTDADKCRRILDAVARTGGRVRVAFNYRWQPSRTKVKELIAGGVIGSVKSVTVDYLLNTSHGADYFRRWHSSMAASGGLLVHKSTHHFDLVNWWLDAIPARVFAQGRLDFYGRANAIARGDAALTGYARYTGERAAKNDPFRFDLRDGGAMESLYLRAEAGDGYRRDQNVFREGIDIYDNMSAVVRYRTGQLLTYSLVSFSPREGMRVGFNGDRGRIEYDEIGCGHVNLAQRDRDMAEIEARGREEIRVYPHFAESYTVPVPAATGGHGGADPLLMEQIFSRRPPVDPHGRSAGHEQGAASVLVGMAANLSIAENRPVTLAELLELRPVASKLSELV